jgi:hypothetical protein
MTYPIDCKNITDKVEFHSEVIDMRKEAEAYLQSFAWCKEIRGCSLYMNLGSKLCIFLFEIDNIGSTEDNFLWIIVGDLPPMYLDTVGVRTIKEVLKLYVELSKDWIKHVKSGQSVEECYPFNAKPTVSMAEILEKKISFIENAIIDEIEDISLA